MSKTLRRSLESILSDLNRGFTYLDRSDIQVAATIDPNHALTHDFRRPPLTADYRAHVAGPDERAAPDYALRPVNKHIGSELALLRTGRQRLRDLLAAPE